MSFSFSQQQNPVAPAPVARPAGNGVMGKFSGMFQSTPYPLMIVVSIIVIVAAILFIVLRLRRGAYKSVDLLKKSIVNSNPDNNEHYVSPAAKLPLGINGNDFSVSMWLYVDNLTITNDHKIILYRGNPTTYTNGRFFVYMDSRTNTVYASVRTSGAQEESSSQREPSLTDIRGNKYFLQSTIDYVPLQRWVHLLYTVKDTTMSTYVDGDLYSVTSIYELPTTAFGSRPLPVRQQGDYMVGGKIGKQGFNGYIGNPTYFNFAVALNDVKLVYKKGPYKSSWLKFVGMGNVGFRNPVYKITGEEVK
jgi:hypothetical protein